MSDPVLFCAAMTELTHSENVAETESGGNVAADFQSSGGIGFDRREAAGDDTAQIAGTHSKRAEAVFVIKGLNIRAAVLHLEIELALALTGDIKLIRVVAFAEVLKILACKIILQCEE